MAEDRLAEYLAKIDRLDDESAGRWEAIDDDLMNLQYRLLTWGEERRAMFQTMRASLVDAERAA